MLDDEKYPTVADPPPGTTAPEVMHGTYFDPQGRDMLVSDIQDPGMIPTYDDAQKEVQVQGGMNTRGFAGAAGVVGTRGGGSTTDSIDKSPRQACGMKRRTYFLVLAALVFVLVGGIVGGTLGGIKANESNDNNGDGGANVGGGGGDGGDRGVSGDGGGNVEQGTGNSDSSTTTSSATATDTGPVPRQTGPIDADERILAAVVAADDDDENLQIFYNDLNTTNILYRRMHDDSSGPEHTLELDIEPNYGTPLAATIRLASSVMTTQLFYVTTRDNETQIAEVTLNCGNLNADEADDAADDDAADDADSDNDSSEGSGNVDPGTVACNVSSNSIISSKFTDGVHPESKLAALRLRDQSLRVYFQASDTNISALNGDSAGEDWDGLNLMGDVRPGSSIAASRSNTSDVHVFFVANQTNLLRTFSYGDDAPGSDDSQAIDSDPSSSWRGSADFDATYIPDSNSFRVFYTNPSSGSLVSYVREGPTADWESNSDNAWGKPASGITAIGWQDELRLFYYQGGRLTVSANDGDGWDAAESVG
ncbi:hypothetical protein FZEAL_7633 [Fusarium zealandicum]|uniref:Fucose-specific lectin n=1 Tax=Fusarium zealandicum TaxID=1053134 RepID=A0A8H4UG90_9HYPO|nr:hypothetical protein FZEAL_7633 [Fusarium zealandicum]